MRAAEGWYRLLLRAYPASFRDLYGREMALLFRDQRRDAGGTSIRFWMEFMWDVARSAPALRLERVRARWERDFQTSEGTMKTMAILAMLIGALESVNGMIELWAGGIVNGDRSSLASGTLVVVAGVLLLVSGIALIRRATRAAELAVGAATACLLVFVFVGLVTGRMSMFAMILGIGFPVALLLFLQITRGRGPSLPTRA